MPVRWLAHPIQVALKRTPAIEDMFGGLVVVFAGIFAATHGARDPHGSLTLIVAALFAGSAAFRLRAEQAAGFLWLGHVFTVLALGLYGAVLARTMLRDPSLWICCPQGLEVLALFAIDEENDID